MLIFGVLGSRSAKLGGSWIRMPSSYPTTPAPVPPGVTIAILPALNAPALRSGLCAFFCFKRKRAPVGPVLSGYFIPLFFIRGGYPPEPAAFLSLRVVYAYKILDKRHLRCLRTDEQARRGRGLGSGVVERSPWV